MNGLFIPNEHGARPVSSPHPSARVDCRQPTTFVVIAGAHGRNRTNGLDLFRLNLRIQQVIAEHCTGAEVWRGCSCGRGHSGRGYRADRLWL